MAQTTVTIRMDEGLKQAFDSVCNELGMNMTTAITILAKKMTRENRLPFEVSLDPFYGESNTRYLAGIMKDVQDGKAHFAEHELIEVTE